MKIFFTYIFTIFIFFVNPVNSEQKVVFIDMDRVISTSNSGSSILKQLNDLNINNLNFLKSEEKKFKEKEAKLISQKNIITKTDFKKKVDELKFEIENYNKSRNKMIKDFNKSKVNNTNNFLKLVNPILVKFSKEKEISIILQKKNLVVGEIELDITDEIIKIINKDISEFKIK